MGLVRLCVCVSGVYAMFLLWAIAQERLSVPFASISGARPGKFPSALFMNTCQSLASALSSLVYLFVRKQSGESLREVLGLSNSGVVKAMNGKPNGNGTEHGKAVANGHDAGGHLHAQHNGGRHNTHSSRPPNRAILLRYLQCAVLITVAAPFGFASLSHISYPTMVLGKSCKLVPVMLMNVLLYRRKFALHKYVVVAMVTAGITMFMGFGDASAKSGKKSAPQSSVYGILLLLINLAIDGATNSTQDEIFSRYRVTGQQMMFFINLFSTLATSLLLVLPLPYIPVIHPSMAGTTELSSALGFIRLHPSVVLPLAQFAVTGALGQLFIFETLQHFGSLTLVTITLTRKMFTMLLSVFVYNHRLTLGQWVGTAVVFGGIGVEAWVKRKDVHAKRVVHEKEKAKLKSL